VKEGREKYNMKQHYQENKGPLICGYDLKLIDPPCTPGADRWSARACLQNDISKVFPYMNAELKKSDYDDKAKILLWKNNGKNHAFRPYEISVAPVIDRDQACEIIRELINMINNIWDRRGEIQPDFTRMKPPTVMEVYTLLPKKNCKECGYRTCMAYAAGLLEGKVDLSQCHLLSEKNRDSLEALFSREV
jgi:ArsR family metal-binding transcriptional regulator